jgi:hypothetical protein
MLKDFLLKKENLFIFSIAIVSVFFIIFGFLLLFFGNKSENVRIIPATVYDISWGDFSSKIINSKIQYPEYMFIDEQKDDAGVGINISEFKTQEFLTYFSEQNHVSIYPEGMDNQLFYGKTRTSDYTSSTGQEYVQTEYLTIDNKIWAVMLAPKTIPEGWQSKGFIWIQEHIKNKEQLCISEKGILINNVVCDPYSGEQPVYRGEVSGKFIRFGYEIINKNSF